MRKSVVLMGMYNSLIMIGKGECAEFGIGPASKDMVKPSVMDDLGSSQSLAADTGTGMRDAT